MLTGDFYKDVLISPARKGDVLYIVSGYATAGMAARHIADICKNEVDNVRINLIVGMTAKDGIAETNHGGFCKLVNDPRIEEFQCAYVPDGKTPVHTKAYAWFRGKEPVCGYVGSANYTQTGFFREQKEAMEESDPGQILKYYEAIEKESLRCLHPDIQGLIRDDKRIPSSALGASDAQSAFSEQEFARCSLLANDGSLPKRSGLNWGQRPEEHRDPNQAYIRVSSSVGQSGFFPPRGHHFTLHTDDGHVMLCCVRQDNAKAIHSSDNSAIGVYFRERLGVPRRALVEKRHLEAYGRTDVVFYKIDDENYLMDFSVPA